MDMIDRMKLMIQDAIPTINEMVMTMNEQYQDEMERNEFVNSVMVKDKVHVLHLRNGTNHGGATVAYRKNGNWVDVAIVHCSDKDQFVRRVGKTLAIESFLSGQTIRVKIPPKNRYFVREMLMDMFAPTFEHNHPVPKYNY